MIDTIELARRADIMALHSRRIRLWMVPDWELQELKTLVRHERAQRAIVKELENRRKSS